MGWKTFGRTALSGVTTFKRLDSAKGVPIIPPDAVASQRRPYAVHLHGIHATQVECDVQRGYVCCATRHILPEGEVTEAFALGEDCVPRRSLQPYLSIGCHTSLPDDDEECGVGLLPRLPPAILASGLPLVERANCKPASKSWRLALAWIGSTAVLECASTVSESTPSTPSAVPMLNAPALLAFVAHAWVSQI